VAVGTAIFRDPTVLVRIVDGLNGYLDAHGYASVQDLVGRLELPT